MAEKKELNPSPRFPSGDYPELSPNPNQREGLVNKTGEKPNTQIVNLPKEQEKRCLTVSEVVELIKKIAPQYGAENVKFTVTNIKSLTDAQCEDLEVGDMVAKKTGNQYHNYIVTYKEKNQGLCLTYADASVVETQSYDYIDGHWVYNSEDKTDFSNIRGLPVYPTDSVIGLLIFRKGTLEWYVPVAQDNITSGDVIALTSDLGKALLDHLEVEINGFRARYEYTDGNYVVYSSKTEADSGLKLQVNMISYNTTNGELSFNQMTFTPDN